MGHRKHHGRGKGKPPQAKTDIPASPPPPVLEVVVKADTMGTLEALRHEVGTVDCSPVEVRVVEAAVGDVTKSDVLMASTGGRLVLGFTVGTAPKVDAYAREQGVEIRLYDVIYHLESDLRQIACSLVPPEENERILCRATVIQLFKSTRKGIILGCRVDDGALALGQRFRVIGAMGVIHEGRVESLHIGADAVREGRPGQEVGLKIPNFQGAKVGDRVEGFQRLKTGPERSWVPSGGVHTSSEA